MGGLNAAGTARLDILFSHLGDGARGQDVPPVRLIETERV